METTKNNQNMGRWYIWLYHRRKCITNVSPKPMYPYFYQDNQKGPLWPAILFLAGGQAHSQALLPPPFRRHGVWPQAPSLPAELRVLGGAHSATAPAAQGRGGRDLRRRGLLHVPLPASCMIFFPAGKPSKTLPCHVPLFFGEWWVCLASICRGSKGNCHLPLPGFLDVLVEIVGVFGLDNLHPFWVSLQGNQRETAVCAGFPVKGNSQFRLNHS